MVLQITAGLADGSIDLVVGTHALIADAVSFQSLGLAIVDEQHRWGHTHPVTHGKYGAKQDLSRTLR